MSAAVPVHVYQSTAQLVQDIPFRFFIGMVSEYSKHPATRGTTTTTIEYRIPSEAKKGTISFTAPSTDVRVTGDIVIPWKGEELLAEAQAYVAARGRRDPLERMFSNMFV